MKSNLLVVAFCTAAVAAISSLGLREVAAQQPAPAVKPAAPVTPATPVTSSSTDAAASTTKAGTSTVPGDQYEAEQLQVWNSAEMMAARDWLHEHSLRSVRFTPQDAEAYLAWIRKMSPQQMKDWLRWFTARREGMARGAEVDRQGRQMKVGRAMAFNQTMRQSYAALKADEAQASLVARQTLQTQQQIANQGAAAIDANRNAQLARMLGNDFTWWIYPTPYMERAAAASLPGDLPRGDPGNYIRGDVPGPEVAAAAAAAAAGAAGGAGAGGGGGGRR